MERKCEFCAEGSCHRRPTQAAVEQHLTHINHMLEENPQARACPSLGDVINQDSYTISSNKKL